MNILSTTYEIRKEIFNLTCTQMQQDHPLRFPHYLRVSISKILNIFESKDMGDHDKALLFSINLVLGNDDAIAR